MTRRSYLTASHAAEIQKTRKCVHGTSHATGEVMSKAKPRTMTLSEVLALTPKQRGAWYRKATAEQLEGLVEPCNGEAHQNAHIDHCMGCLMYEWGITIKRLPLPE